MKYVQPPRSPERALDQLAKGDLLGALKTCKAGNIPLQSLAMELEWCLKKMYYSGNIGTILSGYYFAGVCGRYTVQDLLLLMYAKKDYPGFLKQAYRFAVHSGFEEQVEKAIEWHEKRGLPDARAWRLKFQKMMEQVQLATQSTEEPVKILQEEQSETSSQDIFVELRPIAIAPALRTHREIVEPNDKDPYIVSQVSRRKTERANREHANTLATLSMTLRSHGYDVRQTKLIDAFSVIHGRPVVFEVKSITEENERDQTRHAISQLYEYRFLYSLKDALLCLVFSHEPFSQWLIDYLTQDRLIHVLWVSEDQLTGVSLDQVLRAVPPAIRPAE